MISRIPRSEKFAWQQARLFFENPPPLIKFSLVDVAASEALLQDIAGRLA